MAALVGFVEASATQQLGGLPGLIMTRGIRVRAVLANGEGSMSAQAKLAHHNSVVACARAGGVLPARYRQVSDPQDLEAFCESLETHLLERIETARDAIEIIIRAEVSQPRNPASGSYLRRRAHVLRAAEDGPLSVAAFTRHIKTSLPDRPIQIKDLGDQTPCVPAVHRAVLTRRTDGSAVARSLDAYLEEHCQGRDAYTLLGPLPPYSFLSMDLRAFARQHGQHVGQAAVRSSSRREHHDG